MWRITKRRFWIAVLLTSVSVPCACYAHRTIRFTINRRIVKAAQLKYSEALRPGSNRKDVENYLKSRGVTFIGRSPGADAHSKTPAILVKVADEDAPWYCSEWPDYVAFEFASRERARTSSLWSLADSDVLTHVLETSNGEGCL